jgi:excisionase family DNA binding protein
VSTRDGDRPDASAAVQTEVNPAVGRAAVRGKPRPIPPRLCSIPEAATYLSLSPWTIREMVWRGDLPHVRAGRRVLLDFRDLDAWIDRGKARGV